jgi:DNA-binding NarL/FixJ family response regulator
VAEDYEPFRLVIVSMLRNHWGVEVQDIREVPDGVEAVGEARRLQPDLILLDIGLPSLNGIEAARQIHRLSPSSKIIFVTQESSPDIVNEALNIGACGYVVKADAGDDLLAALTAVLRGEQFLSRRLGGHDFREANRRTGDHVSHREISDLDLERSTLAEITQQTYTGDRSEGRMAKSECKSSPRARKNILSRGSLFRRGKEVL